MPTYHLATYLPTYHDDLTVNVALTFYTQIVDLTEAVANYQSTADANIDSKSQHKESRKVGRLLLISLFSKGTTVANASRKSSG